MYKIQKYVLDNGKEFCTQKECEKALEEEYGQAITTFAHKLTQTNGKYSELIKMIEANLDLIDTISSLRKEKLKGFKDYEQTY